MNARDRIAYLRALPHYVLGGARTGLEAWRLDRYLYEETQPPKVPEGGFAAAFRRDASEGWRRGLERRSDPNPWLDALTAARRKDIP